MKYLPILILLLLCGCAAGKAEGEKLRCFMICDKTQLECDSDQRVGLDQQSSLGRSCEESRRKLMECKEKC